jgi:putative FmdB family regulatory protein
MALIDFECKKCGHKFFEIISPREVDKVKCPKCGEKADRVYKEKFSARGTSSGCGGSCGSCSGCH